jgi:NAD(P)-dependent dehydrogenase (short-subunit alcohol dehydrogenase family)
MRLIDKVAIVTGSGSGMGRTIATRLAGEGANVIVADINEGGMDETVQALTASGLKAAGVKMDVSTRDEVQKTMQE